MHCNGLPCLVYGSPFGFSITNAKKEGGEIMPTPRKIVQVADLTVKMQKMQAVIVADYRGITVAEITTVRNKLRPLGGEFVIAIDVISIGLLASSPKIFLNPKSVNGFTYFAFIFCFKLWGKFTNYLLNFDWLFEVLCSHYIVPNGWVFKKGWK